MRKKLLSLVMAIAVSAGMSLQAEVVASGTCGASGNEANVTWELTDEGLFTISGTGAMRDNSLTSAPWQTYRNYIKSAVIAEGVTTLGDYSFAICEKMTSVSLPSTLTKIGKYAFRECWKLASLTVPAGVTNIGYGVTYGCHELATIAVEAANKKYDSRNNCNAIIETSSNSLIAGGCNTTIPNDVVAINQEAFASQDYITSINIPNGVQTIGEYAFATCKKVTSLYIPASVTSIHEKAFTTAQFTSIVVDKGNSVYDSRNDCNAIIETATNKLVKGCSNTIIPEEITAIGACVFYGDYNLTKMSIPAAVASIGVDAFANCDKMVELTCLAKNPPEFIRNYDFQSIFYSVKKDIPVYVPKASVEAYKAAVGWDYFTNYIGIDEDEPEEPGAEPCSEDKQGTCGENLKWLITCDGELIISGKGDMYDYSIFEEDQKAPWDSYRTTSYQKVTSIVVKRGVTSIGNYAFYGFPFVTTITLPEGITRIGDGGLNACQNLESITLPSTLKEIGASAFTTCKLVTTLTIPAAVERIDAIIFDGFVKITSLSVEEGNKVYDSRNNCNAIIETNTNTLIQGCAVSVIPEGITSIGEYAFQYVDFTSITIPSSVKTIASSAFMGCATLEKITCEAVVPPTIESSWTAFYDVNRDIPIYVPAESVDAYKAAEVWKEFTNIQAIRDDSPLNITAFGKELTRENCKDIFGDGKASYDPDTKTLTLTDLVIDAKGTDYEDGIVIDFEDHKQEHTLTVVINGRCELKNTSGGISSDSGLKLVGGEKGGELVASGDLTQIYGEFVVIDGCDVIATGKHEGVPAIVAADYLEVKNNGHVMAKNTKEIDDPEGDYGYPAIATLNLKSDDNIGLLTKGVHFFRHLDGERQWPGSFFTDDAHEVFASEVEIGKGAIVVPDNQQTTISFNDAENTDAVVFSSSANDFFNSDKEQLEISSTLSDEEVAAALETLVPGSKEWLDKLPGSIAFDVPAGKGTMNILCQTFPGFVLKVKVEGTAAISISQAEMGKATVNYDVKVPTHVVIYLHGESAPAPARIATSAKEAPEAGAYIKSIEINPEDAEEPQACSEDKQGTCGENLKWVITCDGELVITGSGAMTDFSYNNRAPWTAFSSEIKSVSLPEGLTHVGAWSIYQISGIKSVIIPEGVKSIGYVGLSGCRGLEEISLPNSLESIGSMAFSTAAIKSLVIPANVSSIGEGITEECESLETIIVAEENKVFDSREDCNAIIKTATNTLIAGGIATIIPNTVTAIGNMAFSNNRKLGNIRIPNSVESIGDYAFQYCSGFKVLALPTSVTKISGSAFTGCAFSSISVIPGNPKFDSRDNCNAIIETATNTLVKGCAATVMPDGVTAFGEGAFMSCKDLKFINIPASVESLERNALIYCNKLEAITCFAAEPPVADDLAFNYGSASSISINPEIPVYVPGASIEAYKAAKNWSYFTNFVALDGYYTIKALATHGTVTGTGTYAAGTKISLEAKGDEGFEFLEWTDGSHDNPKELTVTADATVRALFKMTEVTEEVIADLSYQADMMTITWDVVAEATIYIVNLYKAGVFIASYKTTDYVNFIELNTAAPAPLRARRSYEEEVPGKITIKIEGLEYGADYSYSIDAYNEEEEVVNVIAGSFNTAEVPTGAEQLGSDINAPRKQLQDGKLMIVLPDGKRFDATGAEL